MAGAFELDISRARTPEAAFYLDSGEWRAEIERVFARSWQLVGHTSQIAADGDYFTAEIGREPLLIVNDAGTLRGFFNVCRHRAGPVAQGCGRQKLFACRYHGWTYDLQGRLLRAPEMEGVSGFEPRDIRLEPVQLAQWGPLVFAALDPQTREFERQFGGLSERCATLGLERMRHVSSRSYLVNANWKVYVDNFLEGYHIPLVHPGLNREIDYRQYVTELAEHHSVQYAPIRTDGATRYQARPGEEQAYYFWLFPNTMLNIYQGQLQANVVIPEGVDRTRVQFEWFAPEPLPDLATDERWISLLKFSDEIQEEDAGICEAVQRNLGSRAYRPGRYSLRRESAVHHFHGLMTRYLR